MTVNSPTMRASYAGNGSTTAFTVPFLFLVNADLTVIIRQADGSELLQVEFTHYTVSGAGNPAGGTLTFLVAPASGEAVVILRDPVIVQGIDYVEGEKFPADTHERGLDLLTMIGQRLADLVGRAFRVSDTTAPAATLSATAVERAGRALIFDGSGNLDISIDPFDTVAEDAAAAIASAAAAATSATNAATSETAAAGSASAAATSATNAANSAAKYIGVSDTALTIAVGSKVLVTQAGKEFQAGRHLLLTAQANPSGARMSGISTAYNLATGDLTVDVQATTGSGLFNDWLIQIDGERGPGGEGWGPELAIVADGARRVFQVAAWEGGVGDPPGHIGEYLGPAGFTSVIGEAVDVRGPTGSGTGNVNSTGAITDGALVRYADGTGDLIEANAAAIPILEGGTGATTATSARNNLGLGTMATQNAATVAITGGTIAGITDLAVADGGTGAGTAAAARTNLGAAALATTQQFTGHQRTGITALTDGATVTPDLSVNNNFTLTIGGNRTLANPTNQSPGQAGSIRIQQDGTGGRTLAFGTNWKFPDGADPTLSTAAGAVDRLDYFVWSNGDIHAALAKALA